MRTPPKNRMNLVGQRFERLMVIEETDHVGKIRQWICVCDCGNKKTVRQSDLTSGKIRSCGCLRSELFRAREKTHGFSGSPEYQVWAAMKARCYNPKHISYKNYGGRGITVCAKWMNDFAAFLLDMGKRPGMGYSLDRIDGSKNYSPDNCQWATSAEQNTNRRNAHLITHNGKTMTITEWSKELHIPRSAISARIHRFKWPTEKALTTPV